MADGSAAGSGRPYGNAPGRRLSYASVASGATQTPTSARSGILSHLTTSTNTEISRSSHPSLYTSNSQHPQAHDSMATKESTVKTPQLPHYSRMYADIGKAGSKAFFVPSYLRGSRYAEKLEADYNAKRRAQRDQSSSVSSATTGPGSNIQRMAPSHRGMTYDIIESNPPRAEDETMPLPSKWNDQDKYPGLEVANDGLDVKYNGSAGKADTEAASIRANYPMSASCGIYYYEVEIKQKSKDCAVAVGFSTQKASLERLPGWEPDSWAYHGDDGRVFPGENIGKAYHKPFSAGDIVGCGLNFKTGTAFFTLNGLCLSTAFRDLKGVRPFPAVGIKKYSGAMISVNFGQRPFVFDIDEMMETERVKIRADIRKAKVGSLHSGLDEQSLVQELVAQFLSHGGYVETADAFLQERLVEQTALNESHLNTTDSSESEFTQAAQRQQIRRAILNGDIDQALDITNTTFPVVVQESPEIVFRLKCRKWVELIRKASDLRLRQQQQYGLSESSSEAVEDVFGQQMELDEQHQGVNGKANNDVSPHENDSDMLYNDLLRQAMDYGQVLQREFGHETKGDYKKNLADIFSLVAYDDPRHSVHGHLLDLSGRSRIAEELNSRILVSLGRSPSASLEVVYRQTEALLEILSRDGGPAAFVNPKLDFGKV